jgi:hypothetical protein
MSDNKIDKKQLFFAGPISEQSLKDNGIEVMEKSEKDNLLSVIRKNEGSLTEKKKSAPRVAFTENPNNTASYAGIFKQKTSNALLPDHVIKQVRTQNHLIASILRARGNQMAMFGHVRRDRFDIGVEIQLKPEFADVVKPSQMVKIKERQSLAEKILIHCGHITGLKSDEKISLADFLYSQSQNGLSFGRFATEIVRDTEGKFHRFRPTDAGTIYPAANKDSTVGDAIRRNSVNLLKQLAQKQAMKIDFSKLEDEKSDHYSWIQVIEGTPQQAFTDKEMIVYNVYPSTDVEHKGFPVTPIDTCISSVTTHLSIDTYNRLYFQNGRAAKGMLVLQSDDVDQATIDNVKQQFNASINSVDNSFRVPIFGVGAKDTVSWQPMVANSTDGEFQFLYDQVARNILSTFNMSPDELPGYGHLSRGTNQQSLSEGSNEFKLTAARDTGIRPLILKFQAFLNDHILPLIDEELAQICTIQLSGFDAQSKDQEALRLQQDMPIHMTYDQVMQNVDKDSIGKFMGGDFPFNERVNIIMDKYLDVGKVYAHFMDNPAAAFDPMLQYKRDAFYFQYLQILMQAAPEKIAALLEPKPYAIDFLKMFLEDSLNEGDE